MQRHQGARRCLLHHRPRILQGPRADKGAPLPARSRPMQLPRSRKCEPSVQTLVCLPTAGLCGGVRIRDGQAARLQRAAARPHATSLTFATPTPLPPPVLPLRPASRSSYFHQASASAAAAPNRARTSARVLPALLRHDDARQSFARPGALFLYHEDPLSAVCGEFGFDRRPHSLSRV
eukprot:1610349-Prymnesium_polylepis.1